MDYDENDYEGQNLHLVGEESFKISSVSCPFALPKFDFDDCLGGHLRFDSLVENEVFLGFSSQEDNQWIDDFSQWNGEIGCSSCAAGSCSLHNNAWSESTTSKSVEMLIKAVGQKEMVPGETIIQESNPGDCLDSITGRMEDNLRQDYKMDNVKDLNIVLPPVEPLENYCGLNERTGVEVAPTKCTSLVHEVKVSADGCLDVNSEMSSFIASRENLPIQM